MAECYQPGAARQAPGRRASSSLLNSPPWGGTPARAGPLSLIHSHHVYSFLGHVASYIHSFPLASFVFFLRSIF